MTNPVMPTSSRAGTEIFSQKFRTKPETRITSNFDIVLASPESDSPRAFARRYRPAHRPAERKSATLLTNRRV